MEASGLFCFSAHLPLSYCYAVTAIQKPKYYFSKNKCSHRTSIVCQNIFHIMVDMWKLFTLFQHLKGLNQINVLLFSSSSSSFWLYCFWLFLVVSLSISSQSPNLCVSCTIVPYLILCLYKIIEHFNVEWYDTLFTKHLSSYALCIYLISNLIFTQQFWVREDLH